MKKLFNLIKLSLNGDSNEVSTARLQSYLIILPILVFLLVFLIIEVWSFGHSINTGKDYHISNEIILIFGMLLAHHLSILFSRSKPTSIADIKGTIKESTESTNTTTTESVTKTEVAKDDVTNI